MSNTINGQIQAGCNLTNQIGSGTAGQTNAIQNLGALPINIGPAQAAGLVLTDAWSIVYSSLSSPQTIDLTNLTGEGGRTVNFTTPGIRFIQLWNCDPTAGHNVKIGPGASNGFAAPWDDGTATTTVNGGMPGASLSTAVGVSIAQPIGNSWQFTNLTVAGWTVDSTHKTLTIDPGASTLTNVVLVIAG